MMTGMTGVGKSSVGNSILGTNFAAGGEKFKRPFKAMACAQSVTTECSTKFGKACDQDIKVVDTPGFFDTQLPFWQTVQEVSKCTLSVAPGPHAILFVVSIGRFTKEVIQSIETMKMIFGDDCTSFLIILLTGKDNLKREGQSVETFLKALAKPFKDLLEECNNRVVAFNNTYKAGSEANKKQVQRLLDMINKLVKTNKGKCYSNEMLQKANKLMEEEKKRQEREVEEQYRRKRELDERETKLERAKEVLERRTEQARRGKEDIQGLEKELKKLHIKLNEMETEKRKDEAERKAFHQQLVEEAYKRGKDDIDPYITKKNKSGKRCIVM